MFFGKFNHAFKVFSIPAMDRKHMTPTLYCVKLRSRNHFVSLFSLIVGYIFITISVYYVSRYFTILKRNLVLEIFEISFKTNETLRILTESFTSIYKSIHDLDHSLIIFGLLCNLLMLLLCTCVSVSKSLYDLRFCIHCTVVPCECSSEPYRCCHPLCHGSRKFSSTWMIIIAC